MSKTSSIQWCHSTVNPVMGCNGCELYPSAVKVNSTIKSVLNQHVSVSAELNQLVDQFTAFGPHFVKIHLEPVAMQFAVMTGYAQPRALADEIQKTVSKLYICYAAQLHRTYNTYGTNTGYAKSFDEPQLFPGRIEQFTKFKEPSRSEISDKPWLEGMRRLIFVSDMGDALCSSVPYEFLLEQLVRPVASEAGSRHIWLWLTKRPGKMAGFSRWLADQNIAWPDNLVAMTSVTGPSTVSRIAHLQKVNAKYRGLSVEPLWGDVSLPLAGIDWVIVGGQSGGNARPFHVEWAQHIRQDCQSAGAAFFVKQLGAEPFVGGQQMELRDGHGGDWAEWPDDLRVRQIPIDWRIAA